MSNPFDSLQDAPDLSFSHCYEHDEPIYCANEGAQMCKKCLAEYDARERSRRQLVKSERHFHLPARLPSEVKAKRAVGSHVPRATRRFGTGVICSAKLASNYRKRRSVRRAILHTRR